MNEPTPMPEWLEKQFDNAQRTVDTWSDGKREAAGIPREAEEKRQELIMDLLNGAADPERKKRNLIADLLEMASERFSNHGCNDFNIEKYFSPSELEDLAVKMNKWNGVTDPNSDQWMESDNLGYDWLLMKYFAYELRGGRK